MERGATKSCLQVISRLEFKNWIDPICKELTLVSDPVVPHSITFRKKNTSLD